MAKKVEEAEVVEQPAPTPPQTGGQEVENVALNVQDLDACVKIIDTALQRGAFRGAEMTSIGTVFDRISAFVNQVKAQQEAKKENADQTAPQGEVNGTG
tara:strand:+ start:666 stop:962 length:297 start_codon:yes stop_codon:yes gene_type:complete